ncbi:MAG: hypothetical protein JXR91_10110 [Deltaproteobacteria bacterium]|nr:hypothetical protein [Deltaproteobacteria bacterium]
MATVIALTDRLLRHIGAGVIKKELNPMEEPLFYRLNMRPDQVKNVITFAESLIDKDI